ncbi:hypothetical protein Dsin_021634 [Dipteronia sinensis]|uniref:Uncharacterized protein n=1 Tax=Dipteronia sinensis TaxID=43782 RepID=A0AAE0DZA2_9ROSI|nr:hypothetical protein Dsin_021634 [Dipteronia sinensis]
MASTAVFLKANPSLLSNRRLNWSKTGRCRYPCINSANFIAGSKFNGVQVKSFIPTSTGKENPSNISFNTLISSSSEGEKPDHNCLKLLIWYMDPRNYSRLIKLKVALHVSGPDFEQKLDRCSLLRGWAARLKETVEALLDQSSCWTACHLSVTVMTFVSGIEKFDIPTTITCKEQLSSILKKLRDLFYSAETTEMLVNPPTLENTVKSL